MQIPVPDDIVMEMGRVMLNEIAKKLKQYESARWDIFPEFDLYMEQLLGCAGAPLELDESKLDGSIDGTAEGDRFEITAHRVNNYVKKGYLPRPDNRRYSREHLARLYVLRMTKGALPLSLLSEAIERLSNALSMRAVSERFAEINDSVLRRVAAVLETATVFGQESESDLDYFALTLAAEANVLSLVSETILARNSYSVNQADSSNDDSAAASSSSGR